MADIKFKNQRFSIRECTHCHKLLSVLEPIDDIKCINCGNDLMNVRKSTRKRVEASVTFTNGVKRNATTIDISSEGMRMQYSGKQIPDNAKLIIDADELHIHRIATSVWNMALENNISQCGLEYIERRLEKRD